MPRGIESVNQGRVRERRATVPPLCQNRRYDAGSTGFLEGLIEASEVVLEYERPRRRRLLQSPDWRRWGRAGARRRSRGTVNYWMTLLVLRYWGRISTSEFDAASPLLR